MTSSDFKSSTVLLVLFAFLLWLSGLRGAWCLGRFAQKELKLRPGTAAGASCDCLKLLRDQARDVFTKQDVIQWRSHGTIAVLHLHPLVIPCLFSNHLNHMKYSEKGKVKTFEDLLRPFEELPVRVLAATCLEALLQLEDEEVQRAPILFYFSTQFINHPILIKWT